MSQGINITLNQRCNTHFSNMFDDRACCVFFVFVNKKRYTNSSLGEKDVWQL